jgi:hypothetical protein
VQGASQVAKLRQELQIFGDVKIRYLLLLQFIIDHDQHFLIRKDGPGVVIDVVDGFVLGIYMKPGQVVVIKFFLIEDQSGDLFPGDSFAHDLPEDGSVAM